MVNAHWSKLREMLWWTLFCVIPFPKILDDLKGVSPFPPLNFVVQSIYIYIYIIFQIYILFADEFENTFTRFISREWLIYILGVYFISIENMETLSFLGRRWETAELLEFLIIFTRKKSIFHWLLIYFVE